jgi:hypothetical protein
MTMIVGLKMKYSSAGDVVQFLPAHDKKPNGEEGLADTANVIAVYAINEMPLSYGPYKATFVELPNIL